MYTEVYRKYVLEENGVKIIAKISSDSITLKPDNSHNQFKFDRSNKDTIDQIARLMIKAVDIANNLTDKKKIV